MNALIFIFSFPKKIKVVNIKANYGILIKPGEMRK
jgi:hypothetical protein